MQYLPNLDDKKKYAVIYADPPWLYKNRGKTLQGTASRHYTCMKLDDIKALPVVNHAADDCTLLLWATDPLLPEAMEVITAWGFKFKTVGFYWVKTNKICNFFTGMGYWTRCNPEQCLLATRGHPQRRDKGVRKLIVSQRREHSRKPDEAYASIEQLVAGPYLELFARCHRPNWDIAVSDEADRFAS